MPFRLFCVLLMVAALASVACGIATPSDNDIDNIAGSIPVGGSDVKTFEARNNGEVIVTITTLTPTPSASLGIAIGQPVSDGCSPMSGYLAPLVANRRAEFGYFNKGSYCVLLYDTGILTAATAYVGTVSHP